MESIGLFMDICVFFTSGFIYQDVGMSKVQIEMLIVRKVFIENRFLNIHQLLDISRIIVDILDGMIEAICFVDYFAEGI